jgi:UDP-N-acetylmuramoyl-L-alanyl-D-glutamate--2,6-diaminopimelate ligase
MLLGEVLAEVGSGFPEIQVDRLVFDSRQVSPGTLFFAIRGDRVDASQFAQAAVASGAVAIVADVEKPPNWTNNIPWIKVAKTREALALAARSFYGRPDEAIYCTGVTGTNGKTTTVFLLDAMLRALGQTTGLMGTVEYRLANKTMSAVNTTPESLLVYQALAELQSLGGNSFSMEVSSHALDQGRVYGLKFRTAIFTNLTQDHLDYHGTMQNYHAAKSLLFEGTAGRAPEHAVLNGDDQWADRLKVKSQTKVWKYGLGADCGVRASEIESSVDGVRFLVTGAAVSGKTFIESKMVGQINVYNLLAAFTAGLSMGFSESEAASGLANLSCVPGRMERVEAGQPFLVLVDYAHTDDAITKALAVARSVARGRVIIVFGCGGDRDAAKRPKMGEAAALGSDLVVLTSDNPRTEEPLEIIRHAEQGLKRYGTPYFVEVDRKSAIELAVQFAKEGDVVLIAGKGHETYQEIEGVKQPFDDREVARTILKGRAT